MKIYSQKYALECLMISLERAVAYALICHQDDIRRRLDILTSEVKQIADDVKGIVAEEKDADRTDI